MKKRKKKKKKRHVSIAQGTRDGSGAAADGVTATRRTRPQRPSSSKKLHIKRKIGL